MLCFIHIEKTAGITIHHIFKNNSFTYVTLTPWTIWANDYENVFTLEEAKVFFKLFPYITGFGGHTPRAYLGYENVLNKKINYITFLREPVSRFLSQYFYHKNVMNINWSLDDFINSEHFNNFMTKRICGKDDPDLAIKILKDKFKFVGLIEKFDESLLLLKYVLNWNKYNMHYEVKNKTPNKNKSEIDPFMIEKIKLHNKNDLIIYEYVKNKIFPKYIEKYGIQLTKEINKFKEEQKNFHFNRFKLLIHGILRHGLYKHVEKILHKKYHK